MWADIVVDLQILVMAVTLAVTLTALTQRNPRSGWAVTVSIVLIALASYFALPEGIPLYSLPPDVSRQCVGWTVHPLAFAGAVAVGPATAHLLHRATRVRVAIRRITPIAATLLILELGLLRWSCA